VPLIVGAATHVMAEWSPAQGLVEIEKFGCTASVTATVFLQTLIGAAEQSPEADLSSLRVWTCAGSPIPSAVVENAKAKLPGASILSLYGRSENLCTTTCTADDDPRRRAPRSRSSGRTGSKCRVARRGTSPTAVPRT
jgi:cyclohexanecarboxylate-CoA ligase